MHANESYSSPSAAARAFITEGMNQLFASMVVHKPGRAQPVRVRKARPLAQDPFRTVDRPAVLAAMNPSK